MANRRFTQFFYTLHQKPVLLDCAFIVNPTDSAGYGITGLKGPGIGNVFMHTSATAATGNPNPASGVAIVVLQDNYNKFFGADAVFVPPVTGSSINISDSSVLTVGQVYKIVTVGTSSTANWNTVGLPVGTVPAVGVPFVASVTGGGTGTGTVKAVGTAGVSHIEVMGNPQLTLASSTAQVLGSSSGSYLMFQFMVPTFTGESYTPAGTNSAPAFTGSALATHNHNFTVKGGQAAATTNRIANYSGPLIGKEEATDATYVGANAATSGGVVGVGAGTPAGTVAAPTFTGTAHTLAGTMGWAIGAPTALTVVHLQIYLSNSGLLNAGE